MTNASLMAISPTMLFMFVLILLVSIYVYDQHKTQVFYLSIVTVDWFYGKLRAKLPILIDSVVNSSHNTVFVVSIYYKDKYLGVWLYNSHNWTETDERKLKWQYMYVFDE